MIDLNLNGTFYTNKVCVTGMKTRGYGRILNIASIAGKEGNPNASAYSASKAGVIGLTKSLGKELAGVDIAVNCITPAASGRSRGATATSRWLSIANVRPKVTSAPCAGSPAPIARRC